MISGLKPSIYTIKVEKTGFVPVELSEMPLSVGQEFNMPIDLRTAGMQETITVTAALPVVDLSSARMGVNVSTFEIDSLPVPTQVIVRGIDKQMVGQTAADIRKVRPPEPDKGQGLRWAQGTTGFVEGVVFPVQVGMNRRNASAAATNLVS